MQKEKRKHSFLQLDSKAITLILVALLGGSGSGYYLKQATEGTDTTSRSQLLEKMIEIDKDLAVTKNRVDNNTGALIRNTEQMAQLSQEISSLTVRLDRILERVLK